jgi:integrase
MASVRKRGKVWYYRYTDSDGVKQERRGCGDKRETEAMAGAAEVEASQIRAGLLDPKAVAYGSHETTPLATHLDDWHAFLIGKESTPKHAGLCRVRVARLIDLGRIRRISDLSPSRVQAALKAVRDGDKKTDGLSLRSLHHYTRVVKGFSRWLWRDGRAREDTLAHLTSPNPDADRRHERRALTLEEMTRLIQTAETGPVVLTLPGPDRAALYRVALGTGFRAAELGSLFPESFHLDDDTPTIVVAAAYSKRRRDDVQPIRRDLADALRQWLASKAPGVPVFRIDSHHTAHLIRADLKAAGIPYMDASGRVADFHALRHSYITSLAMSTAPVKVVQSLARHSTPTLTLGLYAHVQLFDQTAALDGLPVQSGPTTPKTEAATLAATGTYGQHIDSRLAHHLPTTGDGSGRIVSATVGSDELNGPAIPIISMGCNPKASTGLDAPGRVLSASVIAEGEGFEPPEAVTPLRFSRPPRTTRKGKSGKGLRPEPGDVADHFRTTHVGQPGN